MAWTADTHRCSEWRALASCELDGELGELDAARLRRHLTQCGSCAAWFVDVRRLSDVLGTTEPELPRETIAVPALRRRLARASTLAGAGASAAAAALAALVVGLPIGSGTPTSGSLGSDALPASQASAGVDHALLLTTFQQALIVQRPGVQNPAVEIE